MARHPRPEAETLRIYGTPERIAWVQRQPSVVSGESPCVNAHTRGDGVSRKADACWIVPLTATEHDELHRVGLKSFEAAYNIDLAHAASITDARWEQHYAITHQEPKL
jgi:hypothetical protein